MKEISADLKSRIGPSVLSIYTAVPLSGRVFGGQIGVCE
jgi:hypothetical protein